MFGRFQSPKTIYMKDRDEGDVMYHKINKKTMHDAMEKA